MKVNIAAGDWFYDNISNEMRHCKGSCIAISTVCLSVSRIRMSSFRICFSQTSVGPQLV
jgi:riboflavin synthase alpha subunit